MSLEAAFLRQIVAEPANLLHRQIYADWLEEQGDPRAELLRIQEQLRTLDVPDRPQLEARMHELLHQGVQPLVCSRVNGLGMRFVLLFPGSCLISQVDRRGIARRVPVTVEEPFWLGSSVVTQGVWEQIVRRPVSILPHPNVVGGDDYPQTLVNWDRAVDFCELLTEFEHMVGELQTWKYSLPTGTQWEYACRAGTTTPFSFGAPSVRLRDYAWYEANAHDAGKRYAHPVAGKQPNPWGLYDMHGNVWEWCLDQYPLDDTSRTPPGAGDRWRIAYGGSWRSSWDACISGIRTPFPPGTSNPAIGFRVAVVPVS